MLSAWLAWRSCLAALIDIIVVKEGENIGPVGQSAGSFVSLQFHGRAVVLVTPSALEHELVPHEYLLVGRSPGLLEAPSQDVVVSAVSQDSFTQGRILDSKKAAAPAIEAGAEVCMKIGTQGSSSAKTDFVQHPGEIDDAPRAIVGAARDGVLSRSLHGAKGIKT
jgi:hypothetical protein